MKRPKVYKTKQQKEEEKKLKDAGFTRDLLKLSQNVKPMPSSGPEMVRLKDKKGKPITYKF